jgi:uncharacterized protein YuzE
MRKQSPKDHYPLSRPQGTEKNMKVRVDREADALYLRLDENAITESEEVQSGVVLDFDTDGHVVGIEILGLSERVPDASLRAFQFESVG